MQREYRLMARDCAFFRLLITVLAAAVTLLVAVTTSSVRAEPKTLRFATQGSLITLDPYAVNETFTIGILTNVYEGLVTRDADLVIRPGLAHKWQKISPVHWRFFLRSGVRFHNGNSFNADDVLFSAERVRSETSGIRSRVPAETRFIKIDDLTVDVILPKPNPTLLSEWAMWPIMDREWVLEHQALEVAGKNKPVGNFATRHANGTGPFRIVTHEVGNNTVFEANRDWWGKATHNIDRVIFTPIMSPATRAAALLSGAIDVAFPIPVQYHARIGESDSARLVVTPELRTIFLGFDHHRNALIDGDQAERNPFQDRRVREAVYRAIDIKAIQDKIMRGQSRPTAMMVAPELFAPKKPVDRPPYDPDAARALLKAAGYEDGFATGMDCPTNRYVNDAAICQAVVAMLARVGISVKLDTQEKAQFFAKVLSSGGYATSFYLLGWTPGSLDAWNVLHKLHGCRTRDPQRGLFNLGGYCNTQVDELADQIQVETDTPARNALIERAFRLTTDDIAYVPLHQQVLAWGVSTHVQVQPRADNVFHFQWARMVE